GEAGGPLLVRVVRLRFAQVRQWRAGWARGTDGARGSMAARCTSRGRWWLGRGLPRLPRGARSDLPRGFRGVRRGSDLSNQLRIVAWSWDRVRGTRNAVRPASPLAGCPSY